MTARPPLHYAGNVSHSAITVADGDRRLEAAEGSRRLLWAIHRYLERHHREAAHVALGACISGCEADKAVAEARECDAPGWVRG